MEKVKIETCLRKKVGKGIVKKERKAGNIPAIVYGKDINSPIQLSQASLKILRAISFSESTIINMQILGAENNDNFSVLIKDIQYHPLTDEVLHIDFMKVSLEDKIRVHVPLFFKGEPKGVKEGAMVEYILREVEIEGYPLDIPEKIEVDISKLEIGHSIHAENLIVPENLKILTRREETVVTLVSKIEEEAAPVAEEAVATGPEVIKEKKEEVEEETKEDKKEKK